MFPPKCVFCKELLPYTSNVDICESCMGEVEYLTTSEKIHFSFILRKDDVCDDGICFFRYENLIKDLITDYKFCDKPSYCKAIFLLMKPELNIFFEERSLDYIIPIPLHSSRENERGYNQAEYIARLIAKEYIIPLEVNLVERVKNTRPQSSLHRFTREENIESAFKIKWEDAVRDKNIAIVDDVITTGTTAKELDRTFKKLGAKSVNLIVVATGKKL